MPVADSLVWVDPLGVTTDLPATPGVVGRFMPPIRWASKPNALRGGNRLAQVRHGARPLLVPIWLEGATDTELRDLMRYWARVLDPSKGEGILRSRTRRGVERELRCIYTGGLEGDESMEAFGLTPWAGVDFQVAVLSFEASDPYWVDPVTRGEIFRTGTPPSWFPWPPIVIGSSSILADQIIDNPGDVEAYPVWTVTAPFTRVTVRHVDTGRVLIIDATKTTGWITVDTRTLEAYDDAGLSRYADVARDPLSTMFPLAPSLNSITIEVAGSVAGQTELTVAYQARYLTP